MNATSERRLTRPLAAIALVLGVLLLGLFAGLGRAVHWAPPRPVAPLPSDNTGTALPPALPLEHFAAVWQHPLFSPDRKPTVHAAGTTSNLGEMQLTGIILTRGLRIALLHDKKSGKEVRVREGGTLPDGGWTLTQVRARSALFDSSEGRAELKLPAGAPIDSTHGQPRNPAPGEDATPAHGEPNGASSGASTGASSGPPSGAANVWTSNGQDGKAKPDQPPPDQDNPGNPDQGDNPDRGAADGNPNQGSPDRDPNAAPAEQPAPAISQDVDQQQAARIQRLRETILKRRAAQAAAAAHEGDH